MMDRRIRAVIFLVLALAPACDRDDGDDLADTTSETGNDVMTDGGEAEGDGGAIVRDDAGAGDDTDTGGLTGCAVFTSEDDCMFAAPNCRPAYGYLLVDDGDGWCTEIPQKFIGCRSATELCPMLSKTLCDDDAMWRTTDCVPDNLTVCEPPGEITGNCGPSAAGPA